MQTIRAVVATAVLLGTTVWGCTEPQERIVPVVSSSADAGGDAGRYSDASYVTSPCEGLYEGESPSGIVDFDTLPCERLATDLCGLLGLKRRSYSVCTYVGDYEEDFCDADGGLCSCGVDGSRCTLQPRTDEVSCPLEVPTGPVSEGPWGDCVGATDCGGNGSETRNVQVCSDGQAVTQVEVRSCVRDTEGLEVTVGPWGDCTYADDCVETGSQIRVRRVCASGMEGAVVDEQACTRDTDQTQVTEQALGDCGPVDVLDCSELGTQTVSFDECVDGVATTLDPSDDRASQSCELSTTQSTDSVLGSDGLDLDGLLSLVEVSLGQTETLTPDVAFDGSETTFGFTLTAQPSVGGVVITIGDVELDDTLAEGALSSADGTSTGSVDYDTGALSVTLETAPAADTEASATYATAAALTIDSWSESGTTLELCRLVRVHGDLTLTVPDALDAVRLNAVTDVGGDVRISQETATDTNITVELESLERVRGDLTIDGAQLEAISLPALSRIDGSLTIQNGQGSFFTLPSLASVGGSVTVVTNTGLVSFDFGNLTGVGDDFAVTDNDALQSWVTNLSRVEGAFTVDNNKLLDDEDADTDADTCLLYGSYVRVLWSREGIGGAITVNGTTGGTAPYDDPDGDGFVDQCDNCDCLFNAGQADSDGDGVGDDCDDNPETAGDTDNSCPQDT